MTSESVLNYFKYYGNGISVHSFLPLEVDGVPKVSFEVNYYEFGAYFLEENKWFGSLGWPTFNYKGAEKFCIEKVENTCTLYYFGKEN